MTTWKRKIEEYEADLHPLKSSGCLGLLLRGKGGEMEAKRYEDGEGRLEVELNGLRVPDGTTVTAWIDGSAFGEVRILQGRGRLQLGTAAGAILPRVAAGSTAEIQHQGEVLLRGTFRPD